MSETNSFRGASQRHESNGKKHPLVVYVNHEQHELIRLKARAQKVSMSRLLVRSALASEVPVNTAEVREIAQQLRDLTRQISGIATNVNQIAAVINSGGAPSLSITETLAVTREIMQTLVDNQLRLSEYL